MSLTLDGGTGNITGLNVEAGNLPAGSILQVKQTHLTTRFSVSYTPGSDFDITGLNVSITPSSTDSKILVFARLSGEINSTESQDSLFKLRRNGTYLGLTSDGAGSRRTGIAGIALGYGGLDASSTQDSMAFNYLDSPSSTAPLTYQVSSQSRLGTILYVNRAVTDTNTNAYEWLTSSITVMEVAG